ncbi:MAG: 50S ribosome-binding GTPase [Defluviitaleaceae bacterium]|nr:50S ribosome-binding GTPase [Defluviitaleaceae bacterium]
MRTKDELQREIGEIRAELLLKNRYVKVRQADLYDIRHSPIFKQEGANRQKIKSQQHECETEIAFHQKLIDELELKLAKAIIELADEKTTNNVGENSSENFSEKPNQNGEKIARLTARIQAQEETIAKLTQLRQATELRIIITGTMSAGKSTLINALIGEKQAESAAEALTAEIGYFTNNPKPFKTWITPTKLVTIIDTPGVNAALNPEHAAVTHNALSTEIYDKVIYIFNADKLGTEDDMAHLEYVAENVPKDKLIFMLNKVDNFDVDNDSITESLQKLRQDLLKFGYTEPQVFPISAKFSLLLKLPQETFSKMEQRYFTRCSALFDDDYDLSEFYPADSRILSEPNENFARKCGILGLEKILFES